MNGVIGIYHCSHKRPVFSGKALDAYFGRSALESE